MGISPINVTRKKRRISCGSQNWITNCRIINPFFRCNSEIFLSKCYCSYSKKRQQYFYFVYSQLSFLPCIDLTLIPIDSTWNYESKTLYSVAFIIANTRKNHTRTCASAISVRAACQRRWFIHSCNLDYAISRIRDASRCIPHSSFT